MSDVSPDAVSESRTLDNPSDLAEEPEEPEPSAVAVSIRDPAWREAPGLDALGVSRRAATAAVAGAGVRSDVEISIVLADDGFLRQLNRTYRGIDRPTNVLAFAAADEPVADGAPALAGDVVIARETTVAEARDQNKPLADHLAHLVVHGVLHLFGFDHDDADSAAEMERLEVAVLERLRVPNPYTADAAPAARPSREGT